MTHTVRRGEKKGLTPQAKRKVLAPDAEGPGGSGASGHYGLGSSVGSGWGWGRLGGGVQNVGVSGRGTLWEEGRGHSHLG